MSRIRTIKPEFPQSESMGRISREARLCFIMLWTVADDAGRLRGNSRMLASLLYPYDNDATKRMEGWLTELHSERCIRRYCANGDQYIDIPNWLKYQKIDRPSPSKLPPFAEGTPSTREDSRGLGEDSPPEGKGREGKGREGNAREEPRATPPPDEPNETHRALAAKLGVDCDAEWAAFNDRVLAKGKPWFTDKAAAFRGWLRQEHKYAERDGRVKPPAGAPRRPAL